MGTGDLKLEPLGWRVAIGRLKTVVWVWFKNKDNEVKSKLFVVFLNLRDEVEFIIVMLGVKYVVTFV